MGAFDFLLSEEQRIKKEAREIEKGNNLLEAKLELKKAKDRKESLKRQLESES